MNYDAAGDATVQFSFGLGVDRGRPSVDRLCRVESNRFKIQKDKLECGTWWHSQRVLQEEWHQHQFVLHCIGINEMSAVASDY